MKTRIFTAFFSIIAFASNAAHGQDALSNIVRSSATTKPTFAAFDIRPANVSVDAIQEAITAAFKKHFDGIKVTQQIAPYPLPAGAPRMNFKQASSAVGTVSVPECPQAVAIITSTDTSMAKYGEVSVFQGCVFPYRDGLRVNVYALFAQRSGGANINVLGAMLGRVITNAVGIGDSSRFIGETLDDVETRLKAITPEVRLVEMQPGRADKVVAADPAASAAIATAAPAPQPTDAVAPPVQVPQGVGQLPPEVAAAQLQVAALIQKQREAVRAQMQAGEAKGTGDPMSAVQARKDLSAMGLNYYSQEQFVEAVRRGDRIACELFIQGKGVNINSPDKTGVTPLQAASAPEITALLQAYGR